MGLVGQGGGGGGDWKGCEGNQANKNYVMLNRVEN